MKVVNRIKANKDFALAIKNGKSLRTQSYFFHIYKNDFNHIRVGISVSKKLGNAVTRNRIKRQVRAICDGVIDYNSDSYDIVIVVKQGFLERNFWENKEVLHKTLNGAMIGVAK